jgi:hypothetical protein
MRSWFLDTQIAGYERGALVVRCATLRCYVLWRHA